MYPKLFGQDFLNTYGLCIGVGVIMCLYFLHFACKRLKIPSKFEDFVTYNAVISVGVGVLSGMLFQSFYNWIDALKTNPDAKFVFSFSGITFIGGLIGGVTTFLCIYFFFGRKRYGAYLMRLLPIAACCILVAHAFGRLGCLFAGCCYGGPTDSFIGIVYPEGSTPAYAYPGPNGSLPLWPVPIFESFYLFVVFGVCAYLTVMKKYKYSMNIYLITYGIFRFFIEYLRADDRGELISGSAFSPSQIWSIVMVLLGVAMYFVMPYVIKKLKVDFEPKDEEESLEGQVV